ncbi:hypothetical protein P8C59_007284 [Phyllachora maydis]|uniref:Uncharacterized protein n=1 Tax=Phyllachora maydis TaxID=1825666 RepID=A0AAD9I9U8_9PEZI|nr:hypothetical protein P8C59_007284 [Phyllachora maydis]
MDGHTFLDIQNILDQARRLRYGEGPLYAVPRIASGRYVLETEAAAGAPVDDTLDVAESSTEYTLESGGGGSSRASKASSSRTTPTSSLFSTSTRGGAQTTTTTTTTTTVRTGAPQRAFLTQQFLTTADGSARLWCELSALTGCAATFAADDTAGWVDHHTAHLRGAGGELPLRCTCWFCDDVSFQAASPEAAWERLVARMGHVRDHIVHDGMRPADMRPDFFVVDHLWAVGALDADTYREAKAYTELPPHLRWPVREEEEEEEDAWTANGAAARLELEVCDLVRQERNRRRRPRDRSSRRHRGC